MTVSPAPTLLLRCDARVATGAGHVMRSLALAQAWCDAGGRVVHLGALELPAVRARLEKEEIFLADSPAETATPADLDRTRGVACEQGASWVVLDGYRFTGAFQRSVAEAVPHLLMIDDFGTIGDYGASVILDPNFGASEEYYPRRSAHTRLLLGASFALLRREFVRWRDWTRSTPPVARKILVTLGGSDPDYATEKVIAALSRIAGGEREVKIVASASSRHRAALEKSVAACGPAFQLLFDVSNLDEWFAWADLAITAGGLSSWERSLLGLPGLILLLAENQRLGAEASHAAGAARNLGWFDQVDEQDLAAAIQQAIGDHAWRAEAAIANRRLVDGRGAERVVAALLDSLSLSPENLHPPGPFQSTK